MLRSGCRHVTRRYESPDRLPTRCVADGKRRKEGQESAQCCLLFGNTMHPERPKIIRESWKHSHHSLKSRAKRDLERARRLIRLGAGRLAERRQQTIVHALNWDCCKRVE